MTYYYINKIYKLFCDTVYEEKTRRTINETKLPKPYRQKNHGDKRTGKRIQKEKEEKNIIFFNIRIL